MAASLFLGRDLALLLDELLAAPVLKNLTRSVLASLSDEAFKELSRRIRSRVAGRPIGRGFLSEDHRRKRRFARSITRALARRRRAELNRRYGLGSVSQLALRFPKRDSPILTALYPEREHTWELVYKRRRQERIHLERFSFIDNPRGTMAALRKLAEGEATLRKLWIDFDDKYVLDIGPYLVLGLIRQAMTPIGAGGSIEKNVQKVIDAVKLRDFLNMGPFVGLGPSDDIWPLPMRTGRMPGSQAMSLRSATTAEKAVTEVVEKIDTWLRTPKGGQRFRLSRKGASSLKAVMGELLNNAESHAEINDDGTGCGNWTIAGFMARYPKLDGSADARYVCHLAILSEGESIHQSLRGCSEYVRERVTRYSDLHRRSRWFGTRWTEEELWTVAALQDGITRRPTGPDDPASGFGMMRLVGWIGQLGATTSTLPEDAPAIAIISGRTCILVRPPCNTPTGPPGAQMLGLNRTNNIEDPPETDYVFRLDQGLPGTIISIRFVLDPVSLEKLVNDAPRRSNATG